MLRVRLLFTFMLLIGTSANAQNLEKRCLAGNDLGLGLDINVDAQGDVHLSRVARAAGILVHTVVDPTGDATITELSGRLSQIGTDEIADTGILVEDDAVYICNYNTVLDRFELHSQNAIGDWSLTIIANGEDMGRSCDLIRSAGLLRIAWHGADGTLRFSTRMGGMWQTQTIDSVAEHDVGNAPRFAQTGDTLLIAHHDAEGRLRLTSRVGGAAWQTESPGGGNRGWNPAPTFVNGRLYAYHGVVPPNPDVASDDRLYATSGELGVLRTGQFAGQYIGGANDAVAADAMITVFTRQRRRSALFGSADALYMYRGPAGQGLGQTTLEQFDGADSRHSFRFLSIDSDPFGLPVMAYLDESPAAAPVCIFRPRDTDQDRIPDEIEATLGTDPNDADTDNDGRSDGEEVLIDDTDPTVGGCVPAAEICDGVDNDCDGDIDEGQGTDQCGVGICARNVPACLNGADNPCNPGPPAAEICNNGLDDDCDGDTDEGCAPGNTDLVITEVMQDPASVADGLGEWFEVHNAGDQAVDLQNWHFEDTGSDTFTVQSSLLIPAGGQVVLGRYADPAINNNVPVDYAYGAGMNLANQADVIILRDPAGRLVDRVEWDGGADWPNPRGRGRSMQFGTEFDALSDDNNDPIYWCRPANTMPNGDLGTPGAPNTPCTSDAVIVITEVMQDPASVPDGLGEWFEVHNPSDTPVNLAGWIFTDGSNDSVTIAGSLIIPAGGYTVLGRYTDPAINGGVDIDYGYGAGLALANLPDRIIALDPSGTEIDRVAWDGGATWPNPRGRGRSMQFDAALDPGTDDNATPAAWCRPGSTMPNGDLGTPGVANDPCDPSAPLLITEIMQDPQGVADGLGEWFEIHNPDSVPVDILGWTITSGAGQSVTVNDSVMIPAGGYTVLGRYLDPATNNDVPVDWAYSATLLLANQGDELVLFNPAGVEIDRVEWDGGTNWPNPQGRGRSVQLSDDIDPATVDNNDPAHWCRPTSTMTNGELGTPGAANDDCAATVCGNGLVEPGEACDDGDTQAGDGCSVACQGETVVVITEIMQDPISVADGLGEWFELHNPTPVALDLTGWTITDEANDTAIIDALLIPAGGYVVLGRYADEAINGGITLDYAYGPQMSLANQPDRIVLRTDTGLEIDRVEWDGGADWPNPRGRGRTIQLDRRADPFTDNTNNSDFWCRPITAMGDGEFGTPGTRNDLCPL